MAFVLADSVATQATNLLRDAKTMKAISDALSAENANIQAIVSSYPDLNGAHANITGIMKALAAQAGANTDQARAAIADDIIAQIEATI